MIKQISPLYFRDITGYLCPYHIETEAPCLISLPEKPDTLFIMVFSSREMLDVHMASLEAHHYHIKHVINGREFVKSAYEHQIRVMLNPRYEEGKARWTELVPAEAEDAT